MSAGETPMRNRSGLWTQHVDHCRCPRARAGAAPRAKRSSAAARRSSARRCSSTRRCSSSTARWASCRRRSSSRCLANSASSRRRWASASTAAFISAIVASRSAICLRVAWNLASTASQRRRSASMSCPSSSIVSGISVACAPSSMRMARRGPPVAGRCGDSSPGRRSSAVCAYSRNLPRNFLEADVRWASRSSSSASPHRRSPLRPEACSRKSTVTLPWPMLAISTHAEGKSSAEAMPRQKL
mmetsp:Transcript_3319/g.9527  ORF Transcript_3319/g.9527 Transcript_3319/m.9527 type:complete len:243 (-) Transcript_3319:301-1029(-)